MKITEAQMQVAINAFVAALPDGAKFHAFVTIPKVGFADDDAGCVRAIVISEKDEDFDRLTQVINKGISEYRNELGLVASALRKA